MFYPVPRGSNFAQAEKWADSWLQPATPKLCEILYFNAFIATQLQQKRVVEMAHTHTHAWFPHFQFHFPTATQWVLLATLEIYNREIINTIWYITHPSRGCGAFGGQILQPPFLCGVIFAIFPCVRVCVSFFWYRKLWRATHPLRGRVRKFARSWSNCNDYCFIWNDKPR